jgi:hypothetical protein
MDGVVVVVAIGAARGIAAVAPDERDRAAVDRHEQHARLLGDRAQVLIGAQAQLIRQLDTHGAHTRVLKRPPQPRRVCALRQPEATAPACAL